jgi:Na+/proline symporter
VFSTSHLVQKLLWELNPNIGPRYLGVGMRKKKQQEEEGSVTKGWGLITFCILYFFFFPFFSFAFSLGKMSSMSNGKNNINNNKNCVAPLMT